MKFCVKLLSSSDLTIFEPKFRQSPNVRQKSINLNADVFVDQMYPSAATVIRNDESPLMLHIYGPGMAHRHNAMRKITKGTRYKNWRLNGELIHDPVGGEGRFGSLAPGDVAVMALKGEPIPESADIILLSQSYPSDAALCEALTTRLALAPRSSSMKATTREQLGDILDGLLIADDHPIRALLPDPHFDQLVDEAASGSEEARYYAWQRRRPISKDEFDTIKQKNKETGELGEELLITYLLKMKDSGVYKNVFWASEEYATAPFDFQCTMQDGSQIFFDAKTTQNTNEAAFFMSLSEVSFAAQPGVDYRICRLYNLTEDGAYLMVSEPLQHLAGAIMQNFAAVFPGVTPQNFAISPERLSWDNPLWIRRPEEPDDE